MMKPRCTTDSKRGQREKQDRVKAAGWVWFALALWLKRELRTEQLPGQQTRLPAGTDHSVLLGFIMVVWSCVTSTQWNVRKMEKLTHTRIKNQSLNNGIQLLHELITESTNFYSHVAATTKSWTCSRASCYLPGLKHISLEASHHYNTNYTVH